MLRLRTMKKRKLRPMGEIMFDIEKICEEMTDHQGHDLQHGEVLGLINQWLIKHSPHALEKFEEDDTIAVFYHGHISGLK